MNPLQKLISFLGRACFSLIFIIAGIKKLMNWQATEQQFVNELIDAFTKSYQQGWAQALFDKILPMAPILLVIATIIELGGGLMIFLGIKVRFAAFLFVLFLIPVTFLFHDFWAFSGAEQQMQIVMFLKNISILGGSLILLAFGSGPKRTAS